MNLFAEPDDHAIGRSRGGLSTKIHALVDGNGGPLVLPVAPGQSGDAAMFTHLMAQMKINHAGPGRPRTRPDHVRGDKVLRQMHNGCCAFIQPPAGKFSPQPTAGDRWVSAQIRSRGPRLVEDSCFGGLIGKSSFVPGRGFVSVVGAFFEGAFFVHEDAHVWVCVVKPPGADSEGWF